jgi:ribosomal protein S18 acetylase RimI-like enzyme
MGNAKKARSAASRAKKSLLATCTGNVSAAVARDSQSLSSLFAGHLPVIPGNEAGGVSVEVLHAAELSRHHKDAVFELFEANMKALYEQAWGYDSASKLKELFDECSRYILLWSSTPESEAAGEEGCPTQQQALIGFCHFRFELDEDQSAAARCQQRPVLYVYELQITDGHRGRGIGRCMMEALEKTALSCRMEWILLTVLFSNEGAVKFYQDALGYNIDSSSPSKWGRIEPYEILSKKLVTVN